MVIHTFEFRIRHSTFVIGAVSARAGCTALAPRASPRSLLNVKYGFAVNSSREVPNKRRVTRFIKRPVGKRTNDAHKDAGLRGAAVRIKSDGDIQGAALLAIIEAALRIEATKRGR